MRHIIAALLLATVAHAAPGAPDLRQVAATKLATGHLAKWEKARWQQIAAGAVTAKPVTVWLTQYGMWDPQRYKGAPYHIAANPCNLALGTVVYLPATGRLHVVTNRGASSNDAVARRKGAAYWIDVHTTREGLYGWTTRTGTLYVVGKCRWPR